MDDSDDGGEHGESGCGAIDLMDELDDVQCCEHGGERSGNQHDQLGVRTPRRERRDY
jgi:hypothetical protein